MARRCQPPGRRVPEAYKLYRDVMCNRSINEINSQRLNASRTQRQITQGFGVHTHKLQICLSCLVASQQNHANLGVVNAVWKLLGADYRNCILSYIRNAIVVVMQLSVQSVFSAAESAVGGRAIIPFVITTALDSSWAADDKYVRGTHVTMNHYQGIPTRLPNMKKAAPVPFHCTSTFAA